MKLIRYLASPVIVELSNYAGPFSSIKVYLFLLPAYSEELLSTQSIITFLPNAPPLGN